MKKKVKDTFNKVKSKFNNFFTKLKNGIIKVYNKSKNFIINNWKDILVSFVSLIIFIIVLLTIGIILAIILLVLINTGYYVTKYFIKRRKKKEVMNKKGNLKKTKNSNKNSKTIVKGKKKKKNIFKIILIILLSGFIFAVIGIIGFCTYIVINAPEFNEELLYVSEPSIILDKDGNEIAKLGAERRIKITYDELPEVLIDAIVATEDSRFFQHNGVDWARFLKASVLQLMGKSDAGGASTLTMQVSKNAYTDTEASGIEGIIRKFTDLYVSIFILEKNYTKEQIMEFYVNSQWLGRNTYGVEQMSLNYFGKSAKDLNLSEAAMMAGLFQAPGRYDPYKNPEATEKRRTTVLKLMLRHGYINEEEYKIAKELTVDKIVVPLEEGSYNEISPYQSFIDTVVEDVQNKTGKSPYNTSMIIYSTMNTDFQEYLTDIMNGDTFNWENDEVQAGVAVIDVKNGSVVAIGGGRNINAIDTLNYATDITNQIGSTAKPLYDYAPAIEYNNWSTYQTIVDEPSSYSDGHSINNWDGKFQGFETIRTALAHSRNIPALKTFKANDKSKIIEMVTNLGLTPEIYSCNEGYYRDGKKCINKEDSTDIVDAIQDTTLHEAHSIGGYNGESPLTIAAAYSAFANKGIYTEPYTFTKVLYKNTNEEFINDIKSTEAMSEETAYMITDMLITTAKTFIGYNINNVNYAGKTGTTNFDEKTMIAHHMPSNAVNDLWVVGYNTEYTIGIWYGYDSINDEYYNRLSLKEHTRIFQSLGKKVFTNRSSFEKPSGVVSVTVESGCTTASLPSEYTPSDFKQTELFIKGTEPTNVSQRFAKLNDVSNLSATATDGTINITWNSVDTPEINTEEYLRKYLSSVFTNNSYLNAEVQKRLSYNDSNIGDIGYYVYLKNSDGTLKQLDYIGTNNYKTTVDKDGTYTFVVKTAYSIFKSNMSDGKEVSVKVTIPKKEEPKIDDKDKEKTGDKDKETTSDKDKEKNEDKETTDDKKDNNTNKDQEINS